MPEEMTRNYSSGELFHFVGHAKPNDHESNYEVLSKVLRSQCISHPPHDSIWGNVSHTVNLKRSLIKEELIVPTVTCYADIPFDCLGIHVAKYGRFGLSVLRDYLIQYGARPVMYVPHRNDDWASTHGATLLQDIEATYKGFCELVGSKVSPVDGTTSRALGKKPDTEAGAITAIGSVFAKDFLAFIKPFNSQLEEDHPDNFYMEREWRKHGNLKFNPENIQRVVVAEGYLSRLEHDFPAFKGKVVEI